MTFADLAGGAGLCSWCIEFGVLRLTSVTVCRFCLGGCLSPLFGEGTGSIGVETLQLRLC